MIDFDRFWEDEEGPAASGAGEQHVEAWEAQNQVALPTTLRSALRRRDGGLVRDTEIKILPLGEIQPADEEYLGFDEDPHRDLALVFRFGLDMESGGDYLMDYNAGGASESPSVYIHYNDGTGATLIDESFDDFIENLVADSPGPDVDWTEAERIQDVVARETVDLTAFHGAPAHIEQALVRQGNSLVLYSREVSPDGETLAKTTLPLPIHGALTMVQRMRPAPNPTFGLHLQPENHEGIVRLESRHEGDDPWVNTATQGAPVYVRFESADRDRLEAIRGLLFGGAGVRPAVGAGPSPDVSTAGLDVVSRADPAIELLRMTMELKAEATRRFASPPGDSPPPSPSQGDLAALLRQQMNEALERAGVRVLGYPPGAESKKGNGGAPPPPEGVPPPR